MTPIERAIRAVGGGKRLADIIGKSPQFVSQLKNGDRTIPAEYCPVIERATSGAVKCEELRSDVDWGYLRGLPVDVQEERVGV